MQVVLVIISVGLLGVIIFFAVSSKSSRFLKLAALIALVLIGLSLGVASIIIATNISAQNKTNEEARLPIFLNAPAPPSNRGNIIEIIIFLAFFVLIIGMTAYIAHRDHKKLRGEVKKPDRSQVFQDGAEDLDMKAGESQDKTKDDGGFDLKLD